MKKILFKGKVKRVIKQKGNIDDWVIGQLIIEKSEDGLHYYILINPYLSTYYNHLGIWDAFDADEIIEVFPETVRQYT